MTTQQMEALASANVKRIGVAEFKRDVRLLGTRGAAFRIAATFEESSDDPILGGARVRHLLLCVPRLGAQKMARCLRAADVLDFDKRLRELTPRQRGVVAAELRLWVERWQGRSS